MRVGLCTLQSINDTPFYWLFRSLLDLFAGSEHQFSVPLVLDRHSDADSVPLAMADFLTTERTYDVLVFLGADRIDAESAFQIAGFRARHTLLVCSGSAEPELAATSARFEYALGGPAEAVVMAAPAPVLSLSAYPYVSGPPDRRPRERAGPRMTTIYGLESGSDDRILSLLQFMRDDRLQIVTNAATRRNLMERGVTAPIFGYSDAHLYTLLARTAVVVDASESVGGDMHKLMLIGAAGRGIPIVAGPDLARAIKPIDCYPVLGINGTAAELVRQLHTAAVGKPSREAGWMTGLRDFEQKLRAMLAAAPSPEVAAAGSIVAPERREPVVWMAPINGSGLGHIKRLVNISREITQGTVKFCGFGGAIDGVAGLGYDVVPLIGQVSGPSNRRVQLLNYRRLNAIVGDSDCFVFDGGMPYDGVTGMIERKGLDRTVWVRRALFRTDQDNREQLAREKYFARVILPIELFEELNVHGDAFGSTEHRVNPVVDTVTSDDEGVNLSLAGGLDKRLVVTMLGGGATRDVRGELFAICDELSAFEDVVHIVMDWPKSTYTECAPQFWNTRVLKTMYARRFISKASLVISAAGYNSFNEISYARKPALYIPQSAPWLDDQERRAAAAQRRGIAMTCRPGDFLTLRASVRSLLGQKHSAIERLEANARSLELPGPGNAAAAALIMEMIAK